MNYVTPVSTIFAGTQQNSMTLHHLNVDTNETFNEAEEAIVAAAINEEEGTINYSSSNCPYIAESAHAML